MSRLIRLRELLARHPVLREAMIWAIPAVVVGTILRVLLTSCLPYAFWGADSRSYFSFAHRLLTDHAITLDEKRRYFYPLFLAPISILPGPPLRWLALVQHTIGVATLFPLAYAVRRIFACWRLWIVPITAVYAALPVIVWYEHELLGENIFFASFLWAFAGWVAWVSPARKTVTPAHFWWFFVPFAAFILTKPSGRFAWPGLLLGLVFVAGWRRLNRRQIAALCALVFVTLTVGSKKQGAWLLYTATFPLTVLDSPLHADYKREIRDLVLPLQQHPGAYYLLDDEPFEFLENPGSAEGRSLWQALQDDTKKKTALYLDLALEGVRAHPGMFVYFGFQRVVASANLSQFSRERFTGDYYRKRTEHFYAEGERDPSNRVRFAFGLPAHGAIPPYAEFQEQLDPARGSWRLRVVQRCLAAIGDSLDFVSLPRKGPKEERSIGAARPTALGCWLLCGALLSWAVPRYRPTLGVWTLVVGGYLFGVFLFSQQNVRYFAPAWVVLVPLLAAPLDAAVLLVHHAWSRRAGDRKSLGADVQTAPAS